MEEGERVIAPIREVARPVVDVVGPMPYTALQSMLDGGGPKGIRAYIGEERARSAFGAEKYARLVALNDHQRAARLISASAYRASRS